MRGLVHCTDPAGNALELSYGQLALFTPFQPTRPIGGFVTGELGLGHVVLGVADLDVATRFYTEALGFRVTDLYGQRMVFLHCNPRHHSVALADFGMVGLATSCSRWTTWTTSARPTITAWRAACRSPSPSGGTPTT